MAKGKRFSAIDLFSGCGGLSQGLVDAGFNVVGAIDSDALSVSTYEMNRPGAAVLCDIRSLEPGEVMDDLKMKEGELDLLAGCPPCQGFSTLRTLNGGRPVEEPMNDLVFEFSRFVQTFRPKAIMMENVPALRDDDRMVELRKELAKRGYRTEVGIFDAADFDVPQHRRRMILVGARDGGCPDFAESRSGCHSVRGALRHLEAPEKANDPVHNYRVQRTDKVISLIRRIPKDGGSRTDLPDEDQLPCHRGFDGFRDIYGRMAWDRPAPTITGGCINPSKGRFLHPEQDRAITLREAACLQGFPTDYKFDMSSGRYAVARMIGNAFPPKFAEHHASSIRRHLEDVR